MKFNSVDLCIQESGGMKIISAVSHVTLLRITLLLP